MVYFHDYISIFECHSLVKILRFFSPKIRSIYCKNKICSRKTSPHLHSAQGSHGDQLPSSGHGCGRQGRVWASSPGQGAPPCRGAGALHSRRRVCCPGPQDTLHDVQGPHDAHMPDTVEGFTMPILRNFVHGRDDTKDCDT